MTKYTKIDRKNIDGIRKEMQAVLDKYGLDSNMEISIGNIKFSDTSFDAKVSVKISGEKSFQEKQADSELNLMANFYNLSLEECNGKRLTSYKSQNHKYPFIFLNTTDGKSYKCSEAQAKANFGKKEPV